MENMHREESYSGAQGRFSGTENKREKRKGFMISQRVDLTPIKNPKVFLSS